jgi:CDP-paratose 2-epimerase
MNILVTGGCGFIGRNATERFLSLGHSVTVLDDLSRPGSERNLLHLESHSAFSFHRGDLRDAALVHSIIERGGFDVILHLAGQVAVTTSMLDPRHDFEVNAYGTLNVLEAVRQYSPGTAVLNASTNKVYGDLSSIAHGEEETRYTLPGLPRGVSETQPLDFHSPYGCSKGAADQYVMDYSRSFGGLRTVTLRQSCIYGRWQFGIEDQGWVAWFIIAHLAGRPITIYGNGRQVRDILFVDDLVDLYLAAIARIDDIAGMAVNVGGGPSNTLSLVEFMTILEELSGKPVEHSFGATRPGDQPVFISNVERAEQLLGWRPTTSAIEGIRKLYDWVAANPELFRIEGGILSER